MNQRQRGARIVMLAVVLLVSAFAVYASGQRQSAAAGGNASAQMVNPPGVLPIVDNKITLSVMVKGDPRIENYYTNDFTEHLERNTNIHVEWIVADEKEYTQQLNLALTSGNIPDVLLNMGVSPAQQVVYGDQGIFISLTDLIEQYGTRIKEIYAEAPEVRIAMTAPGGKIYSLPNVNDSYSPSVNGRMFLYQPWMESLNLKSPTTLEEFRDVLRAFVTRDPNGNGRNDEIGLIGAISPIGSMAMVDIFLMNSFVYNDGVNRLYVDDGEIKAAYAQPEWRQGLAYLNSLYEDGLLAEQSFTQDRAVLRGVAENPGFAVAGAIPGASVNSITISPNPSNRYLDYQPIAPLIGPNGTRYAVWSPYWKIGQGGFIVTSANRYPEATVRWADYILEYENQLFTAYGKEGEGWRYALPGELDIRGRQAIFKPLVPWPTMGDTINYGWIETGVKYWSDDAMNSASVIDLNDPNIMHQKRLYDRAITLYKPYVLDVDQIVPPLFFDSEGAQVAAELETTILSYVSQMIARFSLGTADIDTEWDDYINTLNRMGLETYLGILQEAYDTKQ